MVIKHAGLTQKKEAPASPKRDRDLRRLYPEVERREQNTLGGAASDGDARDAPLAPQSS